MINLKNRFSSAFICVLLLITLCCCHILTVGADAAVDPVDPAAISTQLENGEEGSTTGNISQQDTVQQDTTQKDTTQQDTTQQDATQQNAAQQDTTQQDTTQQDTAQQDKTGEKTDTGSVETDPVQTDGSSEEYTGKSTGTTKYKGIDYKYVYNYDYYTSKPYGKKYAGKPELAIAHFVKKGMKKQQQAIATFDPVSYRYGCPSLRTEYRDDYQQYYLHYQNTGHKYARYRKYAVGVTKMRKPVTKYGKVDLKAIYDYDYYTSKYPSVIKAVGDDDRAVLKYFVEKGMKKEQEGRDTKLYPKAAPTSSTYKKLQKKIHKTSSFDGTGLIVCIDPGHQQNGDYSHEAIGPGASATKPKVTSGAYGRYSRKNEYEINLEVSLKLEKELKARGYTVVMTRTTHNVHITNIERAQFANKSKADIMVRIHANDISGASSLNGVFCYAAANNNPYLSRKVIADGQRLAVLLRDSQAAATGQRKAGNLFQNDMTGINWAKMPCAVVEMGFMSNPSEDLRLANKGFQMKIAKGLANGIDKYFLEKKK